MQINKTKVSEWVHNFLTDPLQKEFAWMPTKMTSGKWIWLQDYWFHDPSYPSGEFYFKCNEAEKIILILQGCIKNEKLSRTYAESLRERN